MSARPTSSEFIDDLVARQFDAVITDMHRAQGIVRDAIPSILKAFADVNVQIDSQCQTLSSLSAQIGEEGQTGGFLTTMRGVVDSFVKDLVTISSQSMRIVERVGHMGKDVDQVITSVGSIEEMASTTRFIALNAHIEAHRSGPAGTTFRVVAEEVKHLAGDAHTFSNQIRDAAERFRKRLDETRELVAMLASHDLSGAMRAQNELLETVAGIRLANDGLLGTIKSLDQTVQMATRALQFDDILTQLLAGSIERLELIKSVWCESLARNPSLAEIVERNRAGLEKRQVVTQSNLTAGTVDLF